MAVAVTPRLFVGDIDPTAFDEIVRVTTVEQASFVIRHGGVAVLPEGYWATASDVLLHFGADLKHVQHKIGRLASGLSA